MGIGQSWEGSRWHKRVVPGSLLSQEQSGTSCGFSQSDSNTTLRRKPRWGDRWWGFSHALRNCAILIQYWAIHFITYFNVCLQPVTQFCNVIISSISIYIKFFRSRFCNLWSHQITLKGTEMRNKNSCVI